MEPDLSAAGGIRRRMAAGSVGVSVQTLRDRPGICPELDQVLMSGFLRAENVSCSRDLRGSGPVRGVSLAIERGTLTIVCGAEGCGKNLLLRLLGLLEMPDEGGI